MEQGEKTHLLIVHNYSGIPKNIWSVAGQATKNIASAQKIEMYKKIVERFRNNSTSSSLLVSICLLPWVQVTIYFHLDLLFLVADRRVCIVLVYRIK